MEYQQELEYSSTYASMSYCVGEGYGRVTRSMYSTCIVDCRTSSASRPDKRHRHHHLLLDRQTVSTPPTHETNSLCTNPAPNRPIAASSLAARAFRHTLPAARPAALLSSLLDDASRKASRYFTRSPTFTTSDRRSGPVSARVCKFSGWLWSSCAALRPQHLQSPESAASTRRARREKLCQNLRVSIPCQRPLEVEATTFSRAASARRS